MEESSWITSKEYVWNTGCGQVQKMEKDLQKLGLEAMVRSQGFSEVDFRFIHLTMMKRDVYVLKKDLETYVSESRVEGAICLMSAFWHQIEKRIPGVDENGRVKQLRGLLTKSRSDG